MPKHEMKKWFAENQVLYEMKKFCLQAAVIKIMMLKN